MHLAGLKRLLYEDVRAQAPPEWSARETAVCTIRVHTDETFHGEAAASLLAMTPFYWKATQEQQEALMRTNTSLETEVEFDICTYR